MQKIALVTDNERVICQAQAQCGESNVDVYKSIDDFKAALASTSPDTWAVVYIDVFATGNRNMPGIDFAVSFKEEYPQIPQPSLLTDWDIPPLKLTKLGLNAIKVNNSSQHVAVEGWNFATSGRSLVFSESASPVI